MGFLYLSVLNVLLKAEFAILTNFYTALVEFVFFVAMTLEIEYLFTPYYSEKNGT